MILLFLAAAAAAEPPTATDPQRAVEMTRLEAANPPTSEELFDLAELYWSEGRDAYGRASAEHQAALDACARTPGCDAAGVRRDDSRARAWSTRAVEAWRRLLARDPRFVRADEVRFEIAQSLSDLGDVDAAIGEMERLVADFPLSRVVPAARIQIGEYRFDRGEFEAARAAYAAVAALPGSDRAAFAVYKLAWCDYRLGRLREAIRGMQRLVSKDPSLSSSNMVPPDSPVRDLARFFMDDGDLNVAYRYFRGLDDGEALQAGVSRMADLWLDHGEAETAIRAWRLLLRDAPDAAGAPQHQRGIARAYARLGRPESRTEETLRLLAYTPDSRWGLANLGNRSAIQDARSLAEKELRGLAFDLHRSARRSEGDQGRQSARLAERAYAAWITAFAEDPYAQRMRCAYGDLLYEQERYLEAWDQYTAGLDVDPGGSYARRCAEGAIFAAERTDDGAREERTASARRDYALRFPGAELPPEKAPPELPGSPAPGGAPDSAVINETIRGAMSEIGACYRQQLAVDPKLRGSLTVRFVIETDGTVSSAATKSSTLNSPAFEACVNARFTRLRFPAGISPGPVAVSYPFVFTPE